MSHLLLKDSCLIAPLCQSRSLTLLKLTPLPMVFKKAVRKLTTKFQQNQMRFYVTPAFVINLEFRPGLSKNVFSDSYQMFTLHSFFSETRNIWICLSRDWGMGLVWLRDSKAKIKNAKPEYKTCSCIQNHTKKGLILRRTKQRFPSSVSFSKRCWQVLETLIFKCRFYWFISTFSLHLTVK